MNSDIKRLHHLFCNHSDGTITPEEHTELQERLRDDAEARRLWFLHQDVDDGLHDLANEAAVTDQQKPTRSRWLPWRPLAAAAAGLIVGMFSASIVWAVSSPRATTERLFSLINGSFDEQRLERGFPRQIGVWSGDEAAIIDGRLRFIATGSDSSDPSARAISCDVFQLVDLRPLRDSLRQDGASVLELSSRFLDTRPYNTNPSVTFFCQLYLFQGNPATLHQTWPRSIADAVASGSAQVTTLGTDAKGTRNLTAKCIVPDEADFAVIQIAARPNIRPAKLEGLFADDVKLTLKTSPELPIRIVQR